MKEAIDYLYKCCQEGNKFSDFELDEHAVRLEVLAIKLRSMKTSAIAHQKWLTDMHYELHPDELRKVIIRPMVKRIIDRALSANECGPEPRT